MAAEVLIDRDISWLHFNERVLLEAENPEVPLLERLKFLAIFSSNLDEFFRVRVSQLRQWKEVDKALRVKLSLRPNRQLREVLALVDQQQQHFGRAIEQLFDELGTKGIFLVSSAEFTPADQAFLRPFFEQRVAPLLVDLYSLTNTDLKDGGLYLWVLCEGGAPKLYAIPSDQLGRFCILGHKPWRVCFLDEVIRYFLSDFLVESGIKGAYSIKLSRDAELYLEDDYTDGELVEKIQRSLDKRKTGQPTRLLYDKSMPATEVDAMARHLGLGEADLVSGGRFHHLSDFFGFPLPDQIEGLKDEPLPPLPHHSLVQERTVTEQVLERDHLLHLPYQRFEVLERLIEEAAMDPRVTSIKMTLYRLARESRLTDALLKALDAGKKLVLFVEAQARFDEENNIYWGNRFRASGAEVIFSIPQIKVHSKICLIEGAYSEQIPAIAYIGTGNFNAKTALLYTDHGLFTAHSGITFDLAQVFKVLQREIVVPRLKELVVSPFSTRLTFVEWIHREIENARAGRPSGIRIKMNSLEDTDMISYLSRAAREGVPIRLLIRGMCRLPSSTGSNEEKEQGRIEITSIIDRFLEHGRIYCFENGGEPVMLIGSADWMTRNLDRRIEVLTPIYQPDLQQELEDILDLQFNDTAKARRITADGRNPSVLERGQEPGRRSQYDIYHYLSQKWKH